MLYVLYVHINAYILYVFIINMYYYSSYFPKLWYCDHRSETDLTRETRNEKKKTYVCTEKPGLGGQCILVETHQQPGIIQLNEEAG